MQNYTLITPAHNESRFIEKCFEAVAAQTVPPLIWIVVDDASTDDTRAVLERCRARRPDLLKVVTVDRRQGRDFANKVRAFNLGLAQAAGLDHAFVGNLDADITLPSDYYERMLAAFAADDRLGIAGGAVHSRIDGRFVSQQVSPDSVAGAVQLFRRECFEAIGGYRALPNGGIDTAAEIMARMGGWTVRTLPALCALEHRRTGSATASPMVARVREGRRMRSLGYGFPFFLARCVRRALEQPKLIGSLAALFGYVDSTIRRHPVALPTGVVAYLRREQHAKLRRALRRSAWIARS